MDGVWLYGVLRELAPGGPQFPEFGEGHEARLANLRTLVARGKKYGIGVYRSSPEARFIAWDWGWPCSAREVIERLPTSVWLMSVSEWSQPIERGGVRSAVGEYSVSVVGPGPRATQHWAWAKEAGIKTAAKVQLNTSWELASLPYLPVLDLVAQHCHNLTRTGVDGMMLTWSLGGYPSPNLQLAERFSRLPTPSAEEALGGRGKGAIRRRRGAARAEGLDRLQPRVRTVPVLRLRALLRSAASGLG